MTTPRRSRARTATAAVLAACALLAGCGDPSGTDPEDTATPDGSLTAPGTRLAVGRSAVVPVEGSSGVVELTVTSVEPGDPDAVDGLAGMPYYVRLTATVVSGEADGFFAERTVTARAGGERVSTLASPATVGTCSWEHFPAVAPVGSTIQPCVTVVSDAGGGVVDEVVYAIDGADRNEDEPYVTWD